MRIENLGLPGAGKSTLAQATQRVLRAAGHDVITPKALETLDAKHPPGYPGFWRAAATRQSYHIARYLKTHMASHTFFEELFDENTRKLALYLNAGADLSRYRMHQARIGSLWVDEGFFHLGSGAILEAKSWNLTHSLALIEHFFDVAPQPDVVLFVEASVETAAEGIFARMTDKTPAQAELRFNEFFGGMRGMTARKSLIEAMVSRLAERGVPIIRAPGHGDIAALSGDVAQQLLSLKKGADSIPV